MASGSAARGAIKASPLRVLLSSTPLRPHLVPHRHLSSTTASLLCHHRQTPLPTPLGSNRHLSTSTLSVEHLINSSASTPSISGTTTVFEQEEAAAATTSLFEDFNLSPEYARTPKSTLDNPTRHRTPTDALINLLASREYTNANALLADYLSSPSHLQPEIEPHFLFARHAIRLFLNPPEERPQSWLEWWTIAHSKPSHALFQWTASTQLQRQWCEYIAVSLKLTSPHDFDTMERFARVAAEYGHERVVAKVFLQHFAAFAEGDEAERLWSTIRGSVERMQVRAERLAARMVSKEKRKGKGQKGRDSEALAQALQDSVESSRKVFGMLRNRMVRTHLEMGRLDRAVGMVIDSHGEFEKVAAQTLLILFSAAAKANRYDLFEKLHPLLRERGWVLRLHPTKTDKQNLYFPYVVRAATLSSASPSSPSISPSPSPSPSPQEAFVTFRYDHFITPLEEGPSSSTSDSDPRNTSGNDLLLTAISANDLPSASSALLTCVEQNRLPSLSATAQFIHLSRASGASDLLRSISTTIESRGSFWMRGFWATARMLDLSRQGEHLDAVRVFRDNFQLAGLPGVVREAVERVVGVEGGVGGRGRRRPSRLWERVGVKDKVTMDAHSFAIGIQGLVGALQGLASQEGRDEIDALYVGLVEAASREEGIKLRTPPTKLETVADLPHFPGSVPTKTITQLDPFTFLPFLVAYSSDPSKPLESLLSILHTMHHTLHLPLKKEHWGVLLRTYASRGSISDVFFLLDTLDRLPHPKTVPSSSSSSSSSSTSPPPSPALVEFLVHSGIPILERKLDVVVYTSVVTGLRRQGEFQAAWVVVRRFEGRQEGGEGGDAKWVESVRQLRKMSQGDGERRLS